MTIVDKESLLPTYSRTPHCVSVETGKQFEYLNPVATAATPGQDDVYIAVTSNFSTLLDPKRKLWFEHMGWKWLAPVTACAVPEGNSTPYPHRSGHRPSPYT